MMNTLIAFEKIPRDTTEQDIRNLSFLVEDSIIHKIDKMKSGIKIVHDMVCVLLPKILADPFLRSIWQIKKESIQRLDISRHLADRKNSNQEKEHLIKCAKFLLRHMSNVQPSDILTNTEDLLPIMREDYVEQQGRLDTLEVSILKVSNLFMADKETNMTHNAEMAAQTSSHFKEQFSKIVEITTGNNKDMIGRIKKCEKDQASHRNELVKLNQILGQDFQAIRKAT